MWRIPSVDSPRERLSYIDCLLRDVPTDTSERQAGSLSCLHRAQCGHVQPCCSALCTACTGHTVAMSSHAAQHCHRDRQLRRPACTEGPVKLLSQGLPDTEGAV